MILDDIGSDRIGRKYIWSDEMKWQQLNFDIIKGHDLRTDERICGWIGSDEIKSKKASKIGFDKNGSQDFR